VLDVLAVLGLAGERHPVGADVLGYRRHEGGRVRGLGAPTLDRQPRSLALNVQRESPDLPPHNRTLWGWIDRRGRPPLRLRIPGSAPEQVEPLPSKRWPAGCLDRVRRPLAQAISGVICLGAQPQGILRERTDLQIHWQGDRH